MLNEKTLWDIRQTAVEIEDCDLSRATSLALWGECDTDRARGRRAIRAWQMEGKCPRVD